MIEREKIFSVIHEFIEMWTDTDLPVETIQEDSNVAADLGLDSIGILHLVINLEDVFGIHIDNGDISHSNMLIIKNMANLVERKTNENV
jgi:acyl carrier protein